MPFPEGDDFPNPPLDESAMFDEEEPGEDAGESVHEKVSSHALRAARPPSSASSRTAKSARMGVGAAIAKKKKKKLAINLANCRYEVVRTVAEVKGYKATEDEEKWDLYWIDTSVSAERVMRMKTYQKINHFPGMFEISRKVNLARNLRRLQEHFPQEYSFFPQTFLLPYEFNAFKLALQGEGKSAKRKARTYIIKPDAGCQGKGIYLTRSVEEVKHDERAVAQRYLHKPLLMDGYKFDLRIYVLIVSCDPLRVFLYKEGMARFATEKYVEPNSSNLDKTFVHLTNYSLNKFNENFVKPESHHSSASVEKGGDSSEENGESESMPETDSASKRPFTAVLRRLAAEGHDVEKIWKDIGDIVIKTFLTVQPSLSHIYRTCAGTAAMAKEDPTTTKASGGGQEEPKGSSREDSERNSKESGGGEGESGGGVGEAGETKVPFLQWVSKFKCFEILGFDVMLDHRLRPWLIEINHSPSFHTDSEFDLVLKEGVIRDTMNLIQLTPTIKKKALHMQKASATSRLTRYMKARAKITADRDAAERNKASIERRPGPEQKKSAKNQPPPPAESPAPPVQEEEDSKDLRSWWEERSHYEGKHKGSFDMIYPTEDEEKMDEYRRIMETSDLVYNNAISKHKKKGTSKEEEKEKHGKAKEAQTGGAKDSAKEASDAVAAKEKTMVGREKEVDKSHNHDKEKEKEEEKDLEKVKNSGRGEKRGERDADVAREGEKGDGEKASKKENGHSTPPHPSSAPPPISSSRKSVHGGSSRSSVTQSHRHGEMGVHESPSVKQPRQHHYDYQHEARRSFSEESLSGQTTSLPVVGAGDRFGSVTATPLMPTLEEQARSAAAAALEERGGVHRGRERDKDRERDREARESRHMGDPTRMGRERIFVQEERQRMSNSPMQLRALSGTRVSDVQERKERESRKLASSMSASSSSIWEESGGKPGHDVVGRLTARLKEYTRVIDGGQRAKREEAVRKKVQEELQAQRPSGAKSLAYLPRKSDNKEQSKKSLFHLPKTELRLPVGSSDMSVQGRGTQYMMGKYFY
uniref:Tubulin--tyrosine ligase-like protein 9 n=1 Tax=Palpitomonas bilix TaxID=652834 RepID=A0A7S3G977_9EUKA|mmetsp:Transcript_4061/g.7882  ORF Transcript_4061/g.7882 Transcript_4061/m.7882 type:complete len:1040 (+) Transcript_4061:113-3232(+)